MCDGAAGLVQYREKNTGCSQKGLGFSKRMGMFFRDSEMMIFARQKHRKGPSNAPSGPITSHKTFVKECDWLDCHGKKYRRGPSAEDVLRQARIQFPSRSNTGNVYL
jgi:hypothetical protein